MRGIARPGHVPCGREPTPHPESRDRSLCPALTEASSRRRDAYPDRPPETDRREARPMTDPRPQRRWREGSPPRAPTSAGQVFGFSPEATGIRFATAAGTFGMTIVSSPFLSSALTCAVSAWSGNVNARVKVPNERS